MKIVKLIMMCMLLSLLIGCGQTSKEVKEVSDVLDFPTPTEEQLNNGKKNICLITKGYEGTYWATLIEGAQTAAIDNDVNLYVGAVARESMTDEMMELLEQAEKLQPDALVISPIDTAEINNKIVAMSESGIRIIFVDTILNIKNFDICFMTDNINAGRIAAKRMLNKIYDRGHSAEEELYIGVEVGSKASQTITERLAGFYEYWINYAPKKWQVIEDIKCNDGNKELAEEYANYFMDDYENLIGLVGLNNVSTVGIANAVIKRERKDLVVVGFDFSKEIETLVTSNEYAAITLVQRQYDMGYGGVKIASQILDGKEIGQRFYDTGIQWVEKKNVDNPYVQMIIRGK